MAQGTRPQYTPNPARDIAVVRIVPEPTEGPPHPAANGRWELWVRLILADGREVAYLLCRDCAQEIEAVAATLPIDDPGAIYVRFTADRALRIWSRWALSQGSVPLIP